VPLVRAFYAHFGYPYSEPGKSRLLAQVVDTPALGSIWLVLSDAGDAIGYLFLSYYFSLEFGGPTAFIDEFFIDPAHRGHGFGTKVILEVVEAARGLGIRAIQLEVERSNARAAALYTRLGFVDHDRRLLTRVIDHAAPTSA
jgi:ribosomal protein S18 acetylase RimI-like enzyme